VVILVKLVVFQELIKNFKMIKNKKANMTMGLVVALIVMLAVLLIYFYIIPTWILPGIGDITSCKIKQGHCYAGDSCSEIGRDFLSSKASDCKEGEVCCSGPPVEYGLQGGSSSSQSSCAEGKICYTRDNSDGAKIYTTLEFWNPSAANDKKCMWAENVKGNNNLPKDRITFTASVKDACYCKLQLGGIDTKTNEEKFPYFNSGSVESKKGTVINGTCIIELNFDFISPKFNVFEFDVWDASYDNYMGGTCLDKTKNKPMFKLDWYYWTDETECAKTLPDINKAIASSVLMNVPTLDPTNSASVPGANPSGDLPHTIKLSFNERNFLFNKDSIACEFMCEAIYASGSPVSCDFAAVKYVDINEPCPTTLTDYSTNVGINIEFLNRGILKHDGYTNVPEDTKL